MRNIRTDLAMEAREAYGDPNGEMEGVKVDTETFEKDITVTTIEIFSKKGEELLKKGMGRYITVEAAVLKENDKQAEEKISEILSEKIKTLAGEEAIASGVLVAGLGNRNVTPDALGPEVCDMLFVTRHLKQYAPDQIDERINEVSAIAPGVLGITGLETTEIIKGVVEKVKPALIIAIDSLASRNIERLRTTIQLTDSGISPGSGIGNKRTAINKEELNVPVIAIGVPLVVYAATIAQDLLEETLIKNNEGKEISLEEGEKYHKILQELMNTRGAELVVTPKEIDIIVKDSARIIANAINAALHHDMDLTEVARYMN